MFGASALASHSFDCWCLVVASYVFIWAFRSFGSRQMPCDSHTAYPVRGLCHSPYDAVLLHAFKLSFQFIPDVDITLAGGAYLWLCIVLKHNVVCTGEVADAIELLRVL